MSLYFGVEAVNIPLGHTWHGHRHFHLQARLPDPRQHLRAFKRRHVSCISLPQRKSTLGFVVSEAENIMIARQILDLTSDALHRNGDQPRFEEATEPQSFVDLDLC
jgi:hypothetical protein